ncbi:hypothetical protein [Methylococcus geothermalis]|uniref:Uncharacterized protein n=1 Tax=Methylococcus geothermalis TaxID=2681310 RepID=A0A858Q849_9GAMM|nr:hypothetical protein [Methylococcus geothermalis]QJD29975.1 hypothetical protein GNH96_08320 [Methylococcus geothermalis]
MDWKQRLDLHFRKLALEAQGARAAEAEYGRECEAYFRDVVGPVLETFAGALSEYGRQAAVDLRQRSAELAVTHDGAEEFAWAIESHVGAAGWMVYPVEVSWARGKARRKPGRFRIQYPDASFLLNEITSSYLSCLSRRPS